MLACTKFVPKSCTMDHFRQKMFQAWPSPYNVIIAVWLESQDFTNRRHYARTLVPKGLASLLLTPPAGKTLAEHKEDLLSALRHRRSALTTVLNKTLSHLHNHPLPLPRPPPCVQQPLGNPFCRLQHVTGTLTSLTSVTTSHLLPPPPFDLLLKAELPCPNAQLTSQILRAKTKKDVATPHSNHPAAHRGPTAAKSTPHRLEVHEKSPLFSSSAPQAETTPPPQPLPHRITSMLSHLPES